MLKSLKNESWPIKHMTYRYKKSLSGVPYERWAWQAELYSYVMRLLAKGHWQTERYAGVCFVQGDELLADLAEEAVGSDEELKFPTPNKEGGK